MKTYQNQCKQPLTLIGNEMKAIGNAQHRFCDLMAPRDRLEDPRTMAVGLAVSPSLEACAAKASGGCAPLVSELRAPARPPTPTRRRQGRAERR